MKKIGKISVIFLTVAVLVLEILPYGAVLNFANPEGEPLRRTFSYFSLTPLGYANVGPFFTAVLTCFLLLFAVLWLITGKKVFNKIGFIISLVGIATSLLPLIFGLASYSLISGGISLLLIIQAVLFYFGREKQ